MKPLLNRVEWYSSSCLYLRQSCSEWIPMDYHLDWDRSLSSCARTSRIERGSAVCLFSLGSQHVITFTEVQVEVLIISIMYCCFEAQECQTAWFSCGTTTLPEETHAWYSAPGFQKWHVLFYAIKHAKLVVLYLPIWHCTSSRNIVFFYVFRKNVARPQANPTRCLWSRINCTNFAFCEGCASHWQIEGWHLSVPVMFLAKLLKSSSLDPCVSERGTENCIITLPIEGPAAREVLPCDQYMFVDPKSLIWKRRLFSK